MAQKIINFKTHKLGVDWISLNVRDLTSKRKNEIADYLFEFGFASSQRSEYRNEITKIKIHPTEEYKVLFLTNLEYQPGLVQIQFRGINAQRFYDFVKRGSISLDLFYSATLARFDIVYMRPNKKQDPIDVSEFLSECFKKMKRTNDKINIKLYYSSSDGNILKIGSRKSHRYGRIYQCVDSLRFEHEIKSRAINKYTLLFLLEKNLEEFEKELTYDFIDFFGKRLPLEYSYFDWLVSFMRPIRKQKIPLVGLKTDYIQTESFSNHNSRKQFYMLLQLLIYVQELEYQKGFLGSVSYRRVTFQVKDFLKYTKNLNSSYQRLKMIDFLNQLQKNSLIQSFSNNEYRSLVTIPQVKLKKGKYNSWIVEIWIADELFYYAHPFMFPNLVEKKLKKYQFEILFYLVQRFSTVNIEKVFYIENFFKEYEFTITNQQKSKMKEYLISLIQMLKDNDLIESNFKIITSDNHVYSTNELNSHDISHGFIIYEKLDI